MKIVNAGSMSFVTTSLSSCNLMHGLPHYIAMHLAYLADSLFHNLSVSRWLRFSIWSNGFII